MGKLNEIERAKRRVVTATGTFRTAHDELVAANAQLAAAEQFHRGEAITHTSHAQTAQDAQAENEAVLATLRTLIPS